MDIDYRKLAQELLAESSTEKAWSPPAMGFRNKAVSTTPNAIYGHGSGGLFSTPGMSKPLFSAMILPRLGLQASLPVYPSNETNPLYGIITGVTATSGAEPTGVCDDPPEAGVTKLCTHSFVFGRFSRQTRVYDVDKAGRVTNRAEFTDYQMLNQPFNANAGDNPNTPTIPGNNPAQIAQNEISKALFELAVSWSRDFARVVYTGNPANNTAGNGHMEFYGLEYLVNTGYQDAITSQLCPAADSIVRNFGDLDVAANAAALIRNITNIYRNLKHLSSRAGLDPVMWRLVMPFGLFYELTEVWPVSYLTYRATAIPAGSTNFINSADVERFREDMRGDLYNYTGQFLLIDGQRIPVTLDDAMPETDNEDGSFTSDIYFVPMTVLGSRPVTFMEYFNYDGPNGAMAMAEAFAAQGQYQTSDSGRFMWHKKPPANWCVQMLAKTEPRLLLLTPYLAARLQDIRFHPVWHERSAFTDHYYFVDGGRTEYPPVPSYYPPINAD